LSEHRLNIVLPQHELRGHAPSVYEKLARACRPGSAEHLGILRVADALARQALVRCLPPSAVQKLAPSLAALREFLAGQAPSPRPSELTRAARAAAFALLPTLETLTLEAVMRVSAATPWTPSTIQRLPFPSRAMPAVPWPTVEPRSGP
jgi:hypothetical protein